MLAAERAAQTLRVSPLADRPHSHPNAIALRYLVLRILCGEPNAALLSPGTFEARFRQQATPVLNPGETLYR
jgi:hypothetical protein